jgi:hypothetical protein
MLTPFQISKLFDASLAVDFKSADFGVPIEEIPPSVSGEKPRGAPLALLGVPPKDDLTASKEGV